MDDIIQADYDTLQGIAARFDNRSQQVEQLRQRVQQTMDKLREGWQGRGSEAFFAEMEETVLPSVGRLVGALGEATRKTNQIAQLLREADQEAATPFNAAAGDGAGRTAGGSSSFTAGSAQPSQFGGEGSGLGGGIGASSQAGSGGGSFGSLGDYGGTSFPMDSTGAGGAGGTLGSWGPSCYLPAAPGTDPLGHALNNAGFGEASDVADLAAGGGAGGAEAPGGAGMGGGSGEGDSGAPPTGMTDSASTEAAPATKSGSGLRSGGLGGALGGSATPFTGIEGASTPLAPFAGSEQPGDPARVGPGPLRMNSAGMAALSGAAEGRGWFTGAPGVGADPLGNAGGPSGIMVPMGLAAVSPFLALLGKAIKDRSENQ